MPDNVLAQQAANIESTNEYKTLFALSLPQARSFVIPRAEECADQRQSTTNETAMNRYSCATTRIRKYGVMHPFIEPKYSEFGCLVFEYKYTYV